MSTRERTWSVDLNNVTKDGLIVGHFACRHCCPVGTLLWITDPEEATPRKARVARYSSGQALVELEAGAPS